MTQVAVSNPPTTLGLMSCVRESSPPLESAPEIVRHESKRRRFNPLQGLRRIFRKKSRASNVLPVPDASSSPNEPSGAVSDQMSPADPMRSRSTSQLSDSGDPASLKNRGLHSTLLSLSHDSVFTAESNGSEVDASSCLSVQKAAQSSVRAELLDVVRRRKLQREDTSDDEDLGLPRSPLSTSPHHKTITNHSTCSEGSLLSMGSSELEDDSGVQNQSRHSSKVSLYEKKLTITHDSDAELNISVTLPSVPKLSHSAAKHKMAVRPKRTHGAPRKRKHQIGAVTALPATPEVNEDTSSARTALSDSEDTLADHPKQEAAKSTDHLNKVPSLTLLQAKSSSLPVGALPPTSLARSHSNATPPGPPGVKVKSSLSDDYLGERKEESFFSRLLLRRSGKKKKPEEDTVAELPPVIPHKRMDEKGQYLVDMNNISSKQYPSCRQRMEPLNIPLEEAPVNRMHVSYVTSLPEPGDEMDGIQVAKPDAPYLFRSMYAGEFTPVQETFSYKPGDVSPPSSMEVTVPEIHRVPPHQESEDSPPVPEVHSASTQEVTQPVQDTESRDVLVDETVIANVFELTTRSGGSQENLPCLLNETESHQIIISHKSADNVTTDSKPNVETKPGDGRPTITADKPNVTLDRPNIPQKPTACVIPVRPSGRQKPNAPPDTQPSQISKVFLNNSSGEDVVEKEPSSPVQDEHNETSPGQEDIKPVQARDRIQHLSLNLVDTIASPGRESSPLGCSSPRKSVPPSPTLGSSPRKSVPASPNLGSPRKPPGSPLREGSPLKQRSPLREISPFKIATSPGHDLPSPYLSRRLPLASPVTVQGNFFPDETQDGIQRGKEVPSPVTPKDLVLPSPTSPSRGKDSVFSKEIPSPVMPRDVFQFNTPGTPGNTSERESKIGKSASFTEQKKDVPIPAPRISLRKDTSLPSMQTDKSMPEYRKVHVSTQDTKKSMSSSCESLDMQDQVQSSSYSDSCDSMDNIDQWRGGTDNKQTPWRKTDIPWRNRYSEISSSDSDDKQLSITPDGSDIEKKIEEEEISIVQLRRKSFAKDWTRSGDSPPRPLRQKSLEPELLNTSTRNEVVLRRKSLSKEMIKTVGDSDEPPELLKVFARRSLKIPKDFDVNENTVDSGTGSKDSDKENEANTTNEKRSDDRTDKKRLDDKTSENINVQFPLDNDRIKLKKSYESIIITTNKNLDNEDRTKSHQKDLIKPFSGVKVNINEKPLNNMNEAKPLNSNTKVNINEVKPLNTVVKTVNLNTEVIRTEEPTKESPSETNVNKTDVMDNMKGFKKIQQRREEWEQRMQQARKTQP